MLQIGLSQFVVESAEAEHVSLCLRVWLLRLAFAHRNNADHIKNRRMLGGETNAGGGILAEATEMAKKDRKQKNL